ncbi:hypothetical protein KIPB_015201, partial [Kipferlia bialata]|eukprot:g15201.t1
MGWWFVSNVVHPPPGYEESGLESQLWSRSYDDIADLLADMERQSGKRWRAS